MSLAFFFHERRRRKKKANETLKHGVKKKRGNLERKSRLLGRLSFALKLVTKRERERRRRLSLFLSFGNILLLLILLLIIIHERHDVGGS